MARVIITGAEASRAEKNFVPRHSRYRIYSLPDETCVAKGTSGKTTKAIDFIEQIGPGLDDGKYRIKVNKYAPGMPGEPRTQCFANWGMEFYVGLDEATWQRIRFMAPKWIDMTHTTEGIRFKCTMPGCDEVNMNRYGALMHEFKDHFGIDPMQVTDEDIDNSTSASLPMSPLPQMRRGPGRPRKDEATGA